MHLEHAPGSFRNEGGARRRCRGLTLVEVLVGTGLLAATVLGITTVAASTQRLTHALEEKAAALDALERKVQEIEATPFAQVLATHQGTAFTVTADGMANNMLRPAPGDADGMPGSVTVTVPDPPNDASLLLQVTVRVDWEGTGGPQALVRSLLMSAEAE